MNSNETFDPEQVIAEATELPQLTQPQGRLANDLPQKKGRSFGQLIINANSPAVAIGRLSIPRLPPQIRKLGVAPDLRRSKAGDFSSLAASFADVS
jgi:hypothetical protein